MTCSKKRQRKSDVHCVVYQWSVWTTLHTDRFAFRLGSSLYERSLSSLCCIVINYDMPVMGRISCSCLGAVSPTSSAMAQEVERLSTDWKVSGLIPIPCSVCASKCPWERYWTCYFRHSRRCVSVYEWLPLRMSRWDVAWQPVPPLHECMKPLFELRLQQILAYKCIQKTWIPHTIYYDVMI